MLALAQSFFCGLWFRGLACRVSLRRVSGFLSDLVAVIGFSMKLPFVVSWRLRSASPSCSHAKLETSEENAAIQEPPDVGTRRRVESCCHAGIGPCTTL